MVSGGRQYCWGGGVGWGGWGAWGGRLSDADKVLRQPLEKTEVGSTARRAAESAFSGKLDGKAGSSQGASGGTCACHQTGKTYCHLRFCSCGSHTSHSKHPFHLSCCCP